MKTALLVSAAVLAFALPAAAQRGPGQGGPPGLAPRGPTITLYEAPNFQGQSRSFTADVQNMAEQGWNDVAASARVQGRWRVCEDSRMRGRCVDLSGDVADLAQVRLSRAISSIESQNPESGYGYGGGGYQGGGRPPYGPNPGPGGGYGGGMGVSPSLEGRTASFFPNPGQGPWRNADDFCRRMGFSGVIYADDRGLLRDVLCRR